MNKTKYESIGSPAEHGMYAYICPECGKLFYHDSPVLYGMGRFCPACFDGYADAMYRDGFGDVYGEESEGEA